MGKDQRLKQTSGVIFDALGRQLQEGDAVILSTRSPMIFRVMKLLPVLDPNAPSGTMQLHLICMATYQPKGGDRLGEVTRVGEAEEMGPMPLQLIEQVPAPAAAAVEDEAPSAAGPRLVES